MAKQVDVDVDVLRELLSTTPDEFVKTRNDVARTLRSEKRRDAAAAVAALRRPSWTDWALNRAATAEPDDIEHFASAAAEMRDAQEAAFAGRETSVDVRVAMRALREATATVAGHAVAVLDAADRTTPDRAEISARLAELAGSEEHVEHLRLAAVGGGDALLADGPIGEDRERPKPAPATDKLQRGRRQEKEKPTDDDGPAARRETRAAAADERRRLRRERDEALKQRKAAERELRRAQSEVDDAERRVAAAKKTLLGAASDLEKATGRHGEAETELAERVASLDAAESALSAALEA